MRTATTSPSMRRRFPAACWSMTFRAPRQDQRRAKNTVKCMSCGAGVEVALLRQMQQRPEPGGVHLTEYGGAGTPVEAAKGLYFTAKATREELSSTREGQPVILKVQKPLFSHNEGTPRES